MPYTQNPITPHLDAAIESCRSAKASCRKEIHLNTTVQYADIANYGIGYNYMDYIIIKPILHLPNNFLTSTDYVDLIEFSYFNEISILSESWQEIEIRTNNVSGYFARALVNNDTKEVIITHRGTDKWMDGFLKFSNEGINNLMTGLFNLVHEQIYDAELLTSDIMSEYVGYKITHVGHSLGGYLAESMTAIYGEWNHTARSYDPLFSGALREQITVGDFMQPFDDSKITRYVPIGEGVSKLTSDKGEIIDLLSFDYNASLRERIKEVVEKSRKVSEILENHSAYDEMVPDNEPILSQESPTQDTSNKEDYQSALYGTGHNNDMIPDNEPISSQESPIQDTSNKEDYQSALYGTGHNNDMADASSPPVKSSITDDNILYKSESKKEQIPLGSKQKPPTSNISNDSKHAYNEQEEKIKTPAPKTSPDSPTKWTSMPEAEKSKIRAEYDRLENMHPGMEEKWLESENRVRNMNISEEEKSNKLGAAKIKFVKDYSELPEPTMTSYQEPVQQPVKASSLIQDQEWSSLSEEDKDLARGIFKDLADINPGMDDDFNEQSNAIYKDTSMSLEEREALMGQLKIEFIKAYNG